MTHTIASLQDKSPEELTRMLAECLGWKLLPTEEGWSRAVSESHMLRPDGLNVASPPDFATSYDAIMPEVKKLNKEDRFRFISHLAYIRRDSDGPFTWSMIASPESDLTRALILTKQTNEETK